MLDGAGGLAKNDAEVTSNSQMTPCWDEWLYFDVQA